MEVLRAGAQAGRPGPADWFTGEVTVVPLVEAAGPEGLRSAMVSFAAGARTHWHTHPRGQLIHVVSGRGRAQAEGGAVIRIGPGDTVWFAPGERHWHGADPDAAMAHLAVQEAVGGVAVTWGAPVGEVEFQGQARGEGRE